MVDLEHQFGLPLFRTRWHRHHPRRKLMSMGNRTSFSREAKLQWAGSRETNLASGRGRTFFLTSLFIELIDHGRSWVVFPPEPGDSTGKGTLLKVLSTWSLHEIYCRRASSVWDCLLKRVDGH